MAENNIDVGLWGTIIGLAVTVQNMVKQVAGGAPALNSAQYDVKVGQDAPKECVFIAPVGNLERVTKFWTDTLAGMVMGATASAVVKDQA
jgi:hypothetical protein